MKLPTKTVTQRPTMEPSSYIGVLVQIIDLGTQSTEYMGEKKLLRKLKLGFEFPDQKAVFSEEKGEQPFLISREVTASMSSMSNLRKMIEAWRGKKLTDEEAGQYDLFNLLGKTALVNVSEYQGKNGLLYNSIQALSPLPKAMATTSVTPENPLLFFDLQNPDWNVYESLPEFIKKKIAESPEYKATITASDEPF